MNAATVSNASSVPSPHMMEHSDGNYVSPQLAATDSDSTSQCATNSQNGRTQLQDGSLEHSAYRASGQSIPCPSDQEVVSDGLSKRCKVLCKPLQAY